MTTKTKKRQERRYFADLAPVEVARFRMPEAPSSDVLSDKLMVENLSVVLGACVVPSRAHDNEGALDLNLENLVIEVAVDDVIVLEAPVHDVVGFASEQNIYRSEEDPIVLTPREGGVGVDVALSTRPGRRSKPGAKYAGYEVWLFVAR